MIFPLRRLFLLAVIGLTLETGINAATSFARPIRQWTQQELFDEADIVVVATASEPKKSENSDVFFSEYLQQYESELEVRSVFKGRETEPSFKKNVEIKLIKFVQFRYRPDLKATLGNGPSFAVLGTAKFVDRVPTAPPHYLLYIRKRKDGRYEPVSGNRNPVDFINRILIFPERDPALNRVKTP